MANFLVRVAAFSLSSEIDPFFVLDVYSTVLIENVYIYFLTRCHAVDSRENPKTRLSIFCLLFVDVDVVVWGRVRC